MISDMVRAVVPFSCVTQRKNLEYESYVLVLAYTDSVTRVIISAIDGQQIATVV
jgi:hypothetical protein